MNTPSTNYCELAMPVFAEITAGFGGDPTIMAIVDDGVAICRLSSIGTTTTIDESITPVETDSPTPIPTQMP
jgi:hypothetical protein